MIAMAEELSLTYNFLLIGQEVSLETIRAEVNDVAVVIRKIALLWRLTAIYL